MGERLLCKQEVIGSIPFTSTTGCAPGDVPGSGVPDFAVPDFAVPEFAVPGPGDTAIAVAMSGRLFLEHPVWIDGKTVLVGGRRWRAVAGSP